MSVPTLLVRGASSDVITDSGVAELLRVLPQARLVDVPATGHMTVNDDNDEFAGHLETFLEAV